MFEWDQLSLVTSDSPTLHSVAMPASSNLFQQFLFALPDTVYSPRICAYKHNAVVSMRSETSATSTLHCRDWDCQSHAPRLKIAFLHGERERESESKRERERESESQSVRESESQRVRESESQRESQRERGERAYNERVVSEQLHTKRRVRR